MKICVIQKVIIRVNWCNSCLTFFLKVFALFFYKKMLISKDKLYKSTFVNQFSNSIAISINNCKILLLQITS